MEPAIVEKEALQLKCLLQHGILLLSWNPASPADTDRIRVVRRCDGGEPTWSEGELVMELAGAGHRLALISPEISASDQACRYRVLISTTAGKRITSNTVEIPPIEKPAVQNAE